MAGSTSGTFRYTGYNDSTLGQSRKPIHLAALQGQLYVLHGLIKMGRNVNSRTVDGVTPLHEACFAGNVYCARMLIKAGAQVNARNIDGSTPLCDAACSGCIECIDLLLENGATVNDPLARSTPLHEAALRDNSLAVRRLIEAGCHLETSDGHFGTPLHAACFKGNVASAITLLLAGANANATKLHESPLHMAAAVGSPLLVRLLLEFGAQLNHRDNQDRRPIDRAKPNSETYTLLANYAVIVLSLQDACRVMIYRSVQRGRLKDLCHVRLPIPIVDRLLYRALWDT